MTCSACQKTADQANDVLSYMATLSSGFLGARADQLRGDVWVPPHWSEGTKSAAPMQKGTARGCQKQGPGCKNAACNACADHAVDAINYAAGFTDGIERGTEANVLAAKMGGGRAQGRPHGGPQRVLEGDAACRTLGRGGTADGKGAVPAKSPVDYTAEGNQYDRGHFFDFCTGASVSIQGGKWDPFGDLQDITFVDPRYPHVFGKLDDTPEQETVDACHCEDAIPAASATQYAEQFCARMARAQGRDCGYAANIKWATCHIECEFADGGACAVAALRREARASRCRDCRAPAFVRWAAEQCRFIHREGLQYAYCWQAPDGCGIDRCQCISKCNAIPEFAPGCCPGEW